MDIQLIQVVDESFAFDGEFTNTSTRRFKFSDEHIVDAKGNFFNTNYTAILYIPENAYSAPSGIRLFHKKQPGQRTVNYINNTISDIIERDRIKLKFNIQKYELKALKPDIDVLTISLDESGP